MATGARWAAFVASILHGSVLMTMNESLQALLRELIDGPPDAAYILNPGDPGLLRSLDTLDATAASARPGGGACIAAHVDHVRYGLSLVNRWSQGDPDPWATADWSTAWTRTSVTGQEWTDLRRALATEARAWLQASGVPRELSAVEMNTVVSSVAHLAYHLGAMRQIDRAMRGPAEGQPASTDGA